MKVTSFSRFRNWLIHFLRQDLKVIGDGRIALFVSVLMMWISSQHKNIKPRSSYEDSFVAQVLDARFGYGGTMLMIWTMGLLMLISLITKVETFPFERVMLFFSIIFMMISGVLVYQWGVQYNQSFF